MKLRWVLIGACFLVHCGGGGTKGPGPSEDSGTDVVGTDLEAVDGPSDFFGEAEGGGIDRAKDLPDGEAPGPDGEEVTPPCGEECSVTNEYGTCKGWRPCVDGGLGECDAPTPGPEVCDGLDNDCDGETDEDYKSLCDDGIPCTEDLCDGRAGCIHPVAKGFCLIGGLCYEAGDISPHNECLFCLPDKNAKDWSPRPGSCDDGNICTRHDTCKDGICVGEDNVCECQSDEDCPNDNVNPCNGYLFCNHAKFPPVCEVDPATVITCDPSADTQCLANLCDPSTLKCKMTPVNIGKACDDGNPCTYQDTCGPQGVCVGTPYSCDDELPCTEDLCDGAGGCEHVLAPYYCVIGEPGVDAQCIAHGEHHPDNICLWCNAQVQASGWSPWSGPCDDGDPCTKGDICAQGECRGEAYTCDDGLECTTEACDGLGGCKVIEVAKGFCLIDGACVPHGTRNPDNECLWCAEDIDAFGWTQNDLPCDDKNLCTTFDRCVQGVCVGGEPQNCDDDNICTDDKCDPIVGCLHVPNTLPCDDGNPCTVSDRCEEGKCMPGILNACECEEDSDCPEDGDKCNGSLVCDKSVYPHRCVTDPATVVHCDPSFDTTCKKNKCIPETGECAMVPVNEGGACDDADPCTYLDKCQEGACLGTQYSCDDGLSCTKDACRGDGTCEHILMAGFCLIGEACVADGVENSENPCLVCNPSVQKYTWTPKENGTPCDDGEACTYNDACKGGQCRGIPYGCNDLLDCTLDACLGDGSCSHVVKPNFCLIDGACYEEGAKKGECLVCKPEYSQDKWSWGDDGTPCDDGQVCTKDDQCWSGECKGIPYECDDGLPCTKDACLGNGQCDHSLLEGYCLIEGVCYGRGEEAKDNTCLRCLPEVSERTWTPKADGTPCSDDNECTVNDKCVKGACLSGPLRSCDDNNPCTTDQCDPKEGCINRPNDILFIDFEGGSDFSFENSDEEVGWQVVKDIPNYPSAALYYGNPDTWTYETEGKANEGVALSNKEIQISEGQEAYLSFDLLLDNEWSNRLETLGKGRQDHDVLEVFLSVLVPSEPPMVYEIVVWSSQWNFEWYVHTPNGIPLRPKLVRIRGIDLSQYLQMYGYPKFRLGFRFKTQDDSLNTFAGVLIDNIAIGLQCDDQDACTVGDSCQGGECLGLPADCDDGNDCTEDRCDSKWGCQHPTTNEGGPCEDYNMCTEGTTCSFGYCSGGFTVVCEDDNNDCTSDECDPLAGCSYPPVADFSECSQAEPYGTCLGGQCMAWELNSYLLGDYSTGFYGIESSPHAVVGYSDLPDGDSTDPVVPAVFDLGNWDTIFSQDGFEGTLRDVSSVLAVGYHYDATLGTWRPISAVWDMEGEVWSFDPSLNPLHVEADGDAGLLAVAHSKGSNKYFAGGHGQVGDIKAYIEACEWDPTLGGFLPCKPMAAFKSPLWQGECEQFESLCVYGIWAASDSSVWAVGTAQDDQGRPHYTILYYDGGPWSACGGVSGFEGAFYYDSGTGLFEPSDGEGVLYGIGGSDSSNVWAVGTEGRIFARTGWMPTWQKIDPGASGVDWDETHIGYGVFVEEKDVHIVGSISDEVPFYLHGHRDNLWEPWTFDRKVVFWELSGTFSALYRVTRGPDTGILEAVGEMEDDFGRQGIFVRLGEMFLPQ